MTKAKTKKTNYELVAQALQQNTAQLKQTGDDVRKMLNEQGYDVSHSQTTDALVKALNNEDVDKPMIKLVRNWLEGEQITGAIAETTKVAQKTSNFDLVASGKCPHDGASLGDEVAGKGIGITRTCGKCSHRWYLNRQIHTCKCQTCSADKLASKQKLTA